MSIPVLNEGGSTERDKNQRINLLIKELANTQNSIREELSANRVYYVGSNIPKPTISIASPAVVSSIGHGLQAGDRVVFNVPQNTRPVTMTIASPGVFTLNAHGFSAGQPVKFDTTGTLPAGITAGTTYYVILFGLTTNTFEVSATVGGSAVNTSGSQSGTHYCTCTGALPTGITEGTVYFVIAAGLTANAFEVSATLAGSAVNTSGSVTGSPIYNAYTGNDGNSGLAQTRSAALLTVQQALKLVKTIDFGGFVVTVQLADGAYTGACAIPVCVGQPSIASLIIRGNNAIPANVVISITSGQIFYGQAAGAQARVLDMELRTASGYCFYAQDGILFQYGNLRFGVCGTSHIQAFGSGASVVALSNYWIVGGAVCHADNAGGHLEIGNLTIFIVGIPAFSAAFARSDANGWSRLFNNTYSGAATGPRFACTNGGGIQTFGAGVSALPGSIAGSATSPGWYA